VPTRSSTTAFVLATGSVAVEVLQVPNQPIQFTVRSLLKQLNIYRIRMFLCFFCIKKADPLKLNRSEDAIAAWLWKTFIETNGSDPQILPRLPMTKVR
jgi:hypothetical protein